ncbi:hypothetical protein [Roseimicrobium sp. ORNL1]|uniref:hypothetical protein n=1 Tax=Roseimicrobium sp. ORNL1 TaxID=2711231 RepID=UPI0013E1B349|nr:hypothetical protein [Roseimicrobium sp. ORNL1]QIF01942.1 hypothetical protein G5S37_10515 [Roseimicrobium sp. ORNL1]
MSVADTPTVRKRGRWTVWVLAPSAVVLVYVLGIPPLLHCLGPSLPGRHPLAPYPTWAARLAEPWMWLQRTSLLNEPLTRYEEWWMF